MTTKRIPSTVVSHIQEVSKGWLLHTRTLERENAELRSRLSLYRSYITTLMADPDVVKFFETAQNHDRRCRAIKRLLGEKFASKYQKKFASDPRKGLNLSWEDVIKKYGPRK